MMTVSLADVLRGGECWNKAEDHAKGQIRGKLLVTIVENRFPFSA